MEDEGEGGEAVAEGNCGAKGYQVGGEVKKPCGKKSCDTCGKS